MLAIVEPEHLDEVLAICRQVGGAGRRSSARSPASGRLRVLDRPDGEVLADVPAKSLEEDAPLYDRPRAEPADRPTRAAADVAADAAGAVTDPGAALLGLLADTSVGVARSTTTSCSSTPSRRPAATPPCSG